MNNPTADSGGGARARGAVAIGASAGGVEAVLEIARGLPADFPAAVLVVIHTAPSSPALMAKLIERAGRLPATYAVDGEEAVGGRIYLAPPDHHLMVEPGGVLRTVLGPKENGFRPAVDPLFRTAARAWGGRLVGVVLSGYLDDGTLGTLEVKHRGGVVVAQDPRTAACPDMPRSVVENVGADYVVALRDVPGLLVRLTSHPPSDAAGADAMTTQPQQPGEPAGAVAHNSIERKERRDGPPSPLTCPECGGTLWEHRVDRLMQYTCHLGHAYTGESLEDHQVREVEAALWTAMRHLVESAELHRRLAQRMRETGPADRAADYQARAEETERRAGIIRELLVGDRVGGLLGRRPRGADRGGRGDAADATQPPRVH